MKTKNLQYPQNQEHIQQSGKIKRFFLCCLHRWASVMSWVQKIKNGKRVTNSQGVHVRVYTFISLKRKGDANITFYVYLYDYEMKYYC